MVNKYWNFNPRGNLMHAFSHLISRSRSNFVNWRTIGLNSPDRNIEVTELEIKSLEALQ